MSLAMLGLGLGAFNSVGTFIAGYNMQKEGEAGLRNFQHQTLTNVMEGMKPSLEAERLQALERGRTLASLTDVGAGMDAASAMGLLGTGVQTLETGRAKDLASMLQQEEKYDLLRAEDEARMRQMVEARKMEELTSLKAQSQAGLEMQFKSIGDIASTMISYGQSEEMIDALEGYNSNQNQPAGISVSGDKSSSSDSSGLKRSSSYNPFASMSVEPSKGLDFKRTTSLGYDPNYSFGGLGLGQRSKYSSMFPAAKTTDPQKIINFNSLFGGNPDNQYEDVLFKRAL